MNTSNETTALELRSLVKKSGELELSLASVPIPVPQPDEVVVRVEGAPINPSDLGLLFGAADMSTARRSGSAAQHVILPLFNHREFLVAPFINRPDAYHGY